MDRIQLSQNQPNTRDGDANKSATASNNVLNLHNPLTASSSKPGTPGSRLRTTEAAFVPTSGRANVGSRGTIGVARSMRTPPPPKSVSPLPPPPADGPGDGKAAAAPSSNAPPTSGPLYRDLPLQKFQRFSSQIATCTDRTAAVRAELERLVGITKDLEAQYAAQVNECAAMDEQQKRAREEADELNRRIDRLSFERDKIEARLEEFRLENSKLEALLDSLKAGKSADR
ncbi:hypothetical protein BJ742DRAFT_786931 [Cladochytrium replicatum]|nr:hypothetical protein BJ742DRAFT_786931 [Cladochytrium replicatum]